MSDEKKKKGGRPRKEIDTDLLYKLANIHCTMKEMVDIIGVSEDTLKRRYAGIIDKGRAEGKMRLRKKTNRSCNARECCNAYMVR